MNKLSALALGTALSLSLPLAALAQDSNAGVTLDGGVATELGGDDNGVDAGVDAAAGAQAGENGVDLDADADAGVEGGVDAGSNAEVGVGADLRSDSMVDGEAGTSAYTYGDLDAALQGAGTANLSSINADTTIEIVGISTLGDDGEFTADAYGETSADYQSDVTALQGNVEGNADIVAALEEDGYTTDDVVAVWSQADGTLTVFVEDGGDARFTGSDAAPAAGAEGEAGADATVDSTLDAGGTDAGTEVDADARADVEADADVPAEGETTTQ